VGAQNEAIERTDEVHEIKQRKDGSHLQTEDRIQLNLNQRSKIEE
jgi:hypothetical protein